MVFRKFQSISLILILVLNVIIIFNPSLNLPTVQAFPPPDNEGLTNYGGNWDVTGYSYRGNQTIILNGNLTISSGGKLVLRNVTFMLNPDVNGTFHIRVRAGGQLFIYDDTKISTTFLDGNRRTKLWLENNAKFHAENSLIEHCGYTTDYGTRAKFRTGGFYTEATDVYFNNFIFRNCSYGLIVDNALFHGSKSLNNVKFIDCTSGVYFNTSGGDLDGVDFYNCETGITLTQDKNDIYNCNFYNLDYAIYSLGDRTRIRLCNFDNITHAAYITGSDSLIDECIIINTTGDALYFSGENATVFETTLDYTINGIVYDCPSSSDRGIFVNYTRVWQTPGYGMYINGGYSRVIGSSVHNSSVGIQVQKPDSTIVINDTYIDYSKNQGVASYSNNASISNTTIQYSHTGIGVYGSNSRSADNVIKNCTYGIDLNVSHARMVRNNIKNCNFSIPPILQLSNISLHYNIISRITNNTIYLNDTDSITLLGNTIFDNVPNLYISNTTNTALIDNVLTLNGSGLVIEHSTFLNLTGNTQYNSAPGLYINDCTNLKIYNNTFSNNGNGTRLRSTTSTEFVDNKLIDNPIGLILEGVGTTLAGNTFNNFAYDLNLTGNDRTSTTIYHNNFYTGIIAPDNASVWGLGYPGGGNYYDYSDHTDQNSTIAQNLPGPDGLVDEPYDLNTSYNDRDDYPLAVPWPVNRLPSADNFTYDVNATVVPRAVMFIANGSDIEDEEVNLTPVFEYLAPNGTWENASVSFYRYENGTWRANLTHPLNGSRGWYDIRVRFRDTGGYHSDAVYIFKAFNISTEKPVALTFNISSEQVLRTQTLSMQLNGSDPDESEFNLTPHIEIKLLGSNIWQGINYWDLGYEPGNFSGNDTGNYTGGFFSLKITPNIKIPAGDYLVRFRFNDTIYDFSDWFYYNKTITVLNNQPTFDDTSVLQPVLKRTRSTLVYANASDIENNMSNLTCIMQYRAPGGQWVNFTDEYYNATQDQWIGSFSPNEIFTLGGYDIRVEFRDLDNDSTGWNYRNSSITVSNNEPEILKLNITRTSVLRTGFVHIYLDGYDIENIESLLVPVLEYHPPTLPPFAWTEIPGLTFIDGSWRGNFTTAVDYTLGLYSFRARFLDLDNSPPLNWIYQNNSLEVMNNLPVATQLSISLNTIYRGEGAQLTFAGSDIEDANNLLTTEVEYRLFDQDDTGWQSLGAGVYSATNDEWTFEYNAPHTATVTFYDFRIRFTDTDGNVSAWRNLLSELLIMNNLPEISAMTFSHDEIYRMETLTIWINSTDVEDSPDQYFHKELQIKKPGGTIWDSPVLQYDVLGNGLLEAKLLIELGTYTLGAHDFRVKILDSTAGETDWFESISAVTVINRPPELLSAAVTPINGSLDTVFNFTVIYLETETEMPDNISLRIGVNSYTPTQLDHTDVDPFDGVLFYFTTKLQVGVYSFFFSATDEGGGYAESAIWTGLKVEKETIPVEPGKIVGQVTDTKTGEGIPQASVHYSITSLDFTKLTADSDGLFEIKDLGAGTYNIYASASGYVVGIIQEIDVELSKASVINLKLKREESPDAEKYDVEIASSKLVVAKSEDVEVEAGLTDSKGDAVEDDKFVFTWDFGDGSEIIYGKKQSHNYTAAGTYNITLTVFDDKGLIDVAKIEVTVNTSEYIPPDVEPPDNGNGAKNGDGEESSNLGALFAALIASMILVIILAIIMLSMILAKLKRSEKEEGTEDKELTDAEEPGAPVGEPEAGSREPEDAEDAVDSEGASGSGERATGSEEEDAVIDTTEEPIVESREPEREETIEEIEEDDDIKIIIKEY